MRLRPGPFFLGDGLVVWCLRLKRRAIREVDMAFKGSCLCGAVAYEVAQLAGPIGHCHCHTCRKAHAAAYASTAWVMRPDFRWTKGEDAVRAFESSPGKLRHFCPQCGTHLVAERADQPHVILRVGSLDDDPGARPAVHIWTAHDAAWMVDGDADVLRYAEWPPGR